jgi:hypothetical protein
MPAISADTLTLPRLSGRVRQDQPAGRLGPRWPERVAWLSLDAGDKDLARFGRYVAAALDQVCEGVAEEVARCFAARSPAGLGLHQASATAC